MVNRYLKNVTTLKLDEGKCVGCGMCTEVCPHQVFSIDNKKATIVNQDRCMECGACSRNCPFAAIEVKTGVGCAYAIILGWMTGREPSCGCSDEGDTKCC